jgi:hypothetical protein
MKERGIQGSFVQGLDMTFFRDHDVFFFHPEILWNTRWGRARRPHEAESNFVFKCHF